MSEKSSEKSEMSDVSWAQDALHNHVAPSGSKKERIRDAARALGWGHSRTRDVWYGDERVAIRPKEIRRIEEVTGLAYAREELTEIDQLLERMDALLDGPDADKNRPVIAAFRAFIGALDRPGSEGRDR